MIVVRRTLLLVALGVAGAGSAHAAAQDTPLFPILEEGKWGLIDSTGRIVLEPQFDAIHEYVGSGMPASWTRGAGSEARDQIALALSWSRGPVRSRLIGVLVGGKWGYVDRSGRTVIEPQFDALGWRSGEWRDGRMLVQLGRRWGYVDSAGRLVIAADYERAYSFVGGVALARATDRWVLLGPDGIRRGEFAADDVERMDWEDERLPLLRVQIGRRTGAVDRRGRLVIAPQYDGLQTMGDHGLSGMRVKNKWGFVDTTGRVVVPPRFDRVMPFSRGTAVVWTREKSGVIDTTGAVLLPIQMDVVRRIGGGRLLFKHRGNWGVIDQTGRVVVAPSAARLQGLHDVANPVEDPVYEYGFIWARWRTGDGFLEGFIDAAGGIAIPPQFKGVGRFSEGRASVFVGGRRGYIDSTGAVVIPAEFADAERFQCGLAMVTNSDGASYIDILYIDRSGRVVYSRRYLGIHRMLPNR